jgi:hypothetical protein
MRVLRATAAANIDVGDLLDALGFAHVLCPFAWKRC